MFSKIKDKILNLSNSYVFYKSNYEKLLEINSNQEKIIDELKTELKQMNENILTNQIELSNSIYKYNKQSVKQERILNELRTSNETILSNQHDINYVIKNALYPVKEELGGKIDGISSKQAAQDNMFNSLLDKTNEINEISLRIEKSSNYSNIKINSKFNENQRFLEKKFDYLADNAKRNANKREAIDNLNLSNKLSEKVKSA